MKSETLETNEIGQVTGERNEDEQNISSTENRRQDKIVEELVKPTVDQFVIAFYQGIK